jgi:hypothetical protein
MFPRIGKRVSGIGGMIFLVSSIRYLVCLASLAVQRLGVSSFLIGVDEDV